MGAEATLGEFAISLVLVISCVPVKVESEVEISRKSRAFTDGNKNIYPCSNIFASVYISLSSLMGNQTVNEDSNNITCIKYKLHKNFV